VNRLGLFRNRAPEAVELMGPASRGEIGENFGAIRQVHERAANTGLVEVTVAELEQARVLFATGPAQFFKTPLGALEGRRVAIMSGEEDGGARRADAVQLAKCRELRKLYNDAGVNIHLHKIAFGPTDEEIDFNFEVAKALGCVGITTERSDTMAKKLAPFATKHKIWVAFHNHTANLPTMGALDPILELSPYIGFNLDIGHYVAGSKGLSPIPVLEKYHARIVSLHLKDRTVDGGNVPWGQGQTPIKEVLQLIRKERWKFPADIEVEYKIPEGSTAVTEVTKCVQFCKAALA